MAPSAIAQDTPEKGSVQNVLEQLQDAAASMLTSPAGKDQKLLLKATITHSDAKPEVSTQYRSGSQIGKGQLDSLSAENYWYRIPEWAAGQWAWDEQTQLSKYDERTRTLDKTTKQNPAVRSEISGFQRDKNGEIWDFQGKDSTTVRPEGTTFDFNRHMDIISADDSKITYRVDTTRSISSNFVIDRTVQVEGIGVINRDGDSRKVVSQSLKLYDEFGQPVSTTQLVASVRKVAPFSPVDNYNGRDMRKLFNEFLRTHGMQDRIVSP